MSEHVSKLSWKLETGSFAFEDYNRNHTIVFGSESVLQASGAPEYFGEASKANPEQMLVGAVSACHMLTFLALASKKKMKVKQYLDETVGYLEKNEKGRLAVTKIILKPQVHFDEIAPPTEELEKLHERAHKACFIANSILAKVEIQIQKSV